MTTFAAFAITARLSRLSLWLPLVKPVWSEKPEGDISARLMLMLEINASRLSAGAGERVLADLSAREQHTYVCAVGTARLVMFAPLVMIV